MSGAALPAYGMQLFVGGTTDADYVRVEGLREIKPPMRVNQNIKDVSEHKIPADSGYGFVDKMPVPIVDTGEVTGKLNRKQAGTGQAAMLASKADNAAGNPHYFKVLYPAGDGLKFQGFLTKWEEDTPTDGEQAISFTISVTGGLTDI